MAVTMTICTGLRFESSVLDFDLNTHLFKHVVKYVIMLVSGKIGSDLQWHMTVAKVIADLGQLQGIWAVGRRYLFVFGGNSDHMLFVGIRQQVAAAQQNTSGQHNANIFATGQLYLTAALAARVEIQLCFAV